MIFLCNIRQFISKYSDTHSFGSRLNWSIYDYVNYRWGACYLTSLCIYLRITIANDLFMKLKLWILTCLSEKRSICLLKSSSWLITIQRHFFVFNYDTCTDCNFRLRCSRWEIYYADFWNLPLVESFDIRHEWCQRKCFSTVYRYMYSEIS